MSMIFLDLETDGLDYSKIHCMAVRIGVGKTELLVGHDEIEEWFRVLFELGGDHTYIAHNMCGFDWWALYDVLGIELPRDQVIDTYIYSKYKNYTKFNTHSLEEIGKHFGVHKGEFKGDWSEYSEDMGAYCVRDVDVLAKISEEEIRVWEAEGLLWSFAHLPFGFKTEQYTAFTCAEMRRWGQRFDVRKARDLLAMIRKRMASLEEGMYKAWPPELVEDNVYDWRLTKDGKVHGTLQKSLDKADKWVTEGDKVYTYKYKDFNPASPKNRIDKLWDSGWKPWDKTEGYKKAMRGGSAFVTPEKMEHFKKYGWKCNEENLATLPKTAPPAAHDLVEWLTLEGRRSSLEEWLGLVKNGKLHGRFNTLGAWTHRMSHSSPNQANIPSVWPEGVEPKTASDRVKKEFNGQMRSLFMADDHGYMVGCDADGIQLRVLAHYMDSKEYTDAILSGDKSKGTDIHSLNQKALGTICKSRDDAKTFIYAWLLGAGIPKIASILGCNIKQAKKAVDDFLEAIPELNKLKKITIPTYAARGGFKALDGRWIRCSSQHLMLAGMLQSGEAIIMKQAMKYWKLWLESEGVMFRPVNFIHDEWQTVVFGGKDQAEYVGQVQTDSLRRAAYHLGVSCPISGSYRIGKNWEETH